MAKTQLLQAYFFMTTLLSGLTVAAQTGEGQLAAFHAAAGATFAQLGGNGNLMHVHHRVAAAADEVDMGLRIGIEPLRAVYGGHAGDAALLFEKGQVAINRCL